MRKPLHPRGGRKRADRGSERQRRDDTPDQVAVPRMLDRAGGRRDQNDRDKEKLGVADKKIAYFDRPLAGENQWDCRFGLALRRLAFVFHLHSKPGQVRAAKFAATIPRDCQASNSRMRSIGGAFARRSRAGFE